MTVNDETEHLSMSRQILDYNQIISDLLSIKDGHDAIRRRAGRKLGVTGPQWAIIQTINDLDRSGYGVSVGEVSAKLHVAGSSITANSKLLEKRGMLTRVASSTDARMVLMSLPLANSKELTKVLGQWDTLQSFIFADFDATALGDMKRWLARLKKRFGVAASRGGDGISEGMDAAALGFESRPKRRLSQNDEL